MVLNVCLIAWIGWVGAAIATGTSAFVALILSYWSLMWVVDFDIPVRELLRQLAAAAVMSVILWRIRDFVRVPLLSGRTDEVLFLIGVGAVVYFAVLVGIWQDFRRVIRNNVTGPFE